MLFCNNHTSQVNCKCVHSHRATIKFTNTEAPTDVFYILLKNQWTVDHNRYWNIFLGF